jgi:hypothetical protein
VKKVIINLLAFLMTVGSWRLVPGDFFDPFSLPRGKYAHNSNGHTTQEAEPDRIHHEP